MGSAKEYLGNIKKLDNLINSLIAEHDSMKAMATKVTATYEGERVQASSSQERMADTVAKMIDYQNQINENIDKFVDMKSSILQVLHTLDNADYISILYKRYFEYKAWEVIACEMGYTYRWVTKLHGRALNCMDNILNEKK